MVVVSRSGKVYECRGEPREGGQAEVYRVVTEDERTVAVKVDRRRRKGGSVDAEADRVEELLQKWPDLARHVVPILDRGTSDDDRAFFVMPWRESTLRDWLVGRSLEAILLACTRLADSVSRLQYGPEGHRGTVVHRDIKPENCFVVGEGPTLRVELSDFGVAGAKHRREAAPLTGVGTEGYAPLDQVLPRTTVERDASWDVHALGVTIYESLVGSRPRAVLEAMNRLTPAGGALLLTTRTEEAAVSEVRELRELMDVDDAVGLTPDDRTALTEGLRDALARDAAHLDRGTVAAWTEPLARGLADALARALSPDPRRRSPDARGLREALDQALDGVRRAKRGERAPSVPRQRTWWPVLLATVSMLLVAAFAATSSVRRARTVVLTLDGPPGYALTAALQSVERTWALEPHTPIIVPHGDYTLAIRGTRDSRCPVFTTQAVTVGRGLGTLHLEPQLTVPPCPTADHDYALVDVPRAEELTLGASEAEWFPEADEPLRSVTLGRPFRLGRVEVTQALFHDVTGRDPVADARVGLGDGRPCATYKGVSLQGDDLPVMCVTWCEAVQFANALSRLEGLREAYPNAADCAAGAEVLWDRDSPGWRLPTEAEWAWAARAGGRHSLVAGALASDERACQEATLYANVADATFVARFPMLGGGGDARDFYTDACRRQALNADGFVGLAPVASLLPNDWAIHDLSGNVREWVFDGYVEAPPGGLDPLVRPTGGRPRVYRGSAFDDDAEHLRLANRGYEAPDRRLKYVGLRLAMNAPER